ncbi:DUF2510 domain-containing protein [Tessaracoccus oleiagri]|uniref:DUF2510 domain-containing protein n=1 Tax=Tessaracoccus oleiagri TaxID=686624 RepID=A0A1G9KXL4_9ACTN|nr:DUF2510 domain-containing protein [Tessaracoccus oleiagri]SDL54207.1 Protein of unknown function [Tessaracoccus oleiagri]
MSQPGWYPDPEGRGGPRYWDGTRWLAPDAQARPRGNRGLWWFVAGLVVIAAIVLALVLGPRGLGFGSTAQPDTRSERPSVQPWDERSESPSEPGETDEGAAQPEECPSVGSPVSRVDADGRLRGGGLSVEAPTAPGWELSPTWMPWMSEQNSVTRMVVPGWVASVDVGTVRHADGFTSPERAARNIISCMASSWMFQDFTHSETLASQPFSLDGHEGWYIKENVYVSGREVAGDVLDVFVLDLGRDGELSVIVGCATQDHDPSISEVQAALDTMRVD